MPNLAVHNAIQELLLRDQFASIPALGGFLLRPADSTVNAYTKELKPTHSQLVFNPQLSENDGQMAHLISVSQGISYKEAMTQIELVVSELQTQLKSKRYATFFPFGNFFQNENKGIFFVPRQQFNLHLPNYGLQPLKWESQNNNWKNTQKQTKIAVSSLNNTLLSPAKQIEEDAQVVGVSDEHIETIQKKQHDNIWWNIAASFVIFSVSALTVTIATMTWLGAYQERQAYASMSPSMNANQLSNKVETATTPHKESDFVYINGKLIKIKNSRSNKELTNESQSINESITSAFTENHATSENLEDEDLLNPSTYLNHLLDKDGTFFLIAGTYITHKAAQIECRQWNGMGTPAAIFKPKNSSFYRIVLGRFLSKEDATKYSVTIKTFRGASISMTRWNLR